MTRKRSTGQSAEHRLSTAQRHDQARAWLQHVGRQVTPQAVQELAPWMGRYEPGTGYEKAAIELVARGEIPTHSKVGTLAKQRAQIRIERRARRRTVIGVEELDLDQEHLQRLLDFITVHWAEHGTGPGWAQVREHMGWTKGQIEGTLTRLRSQGVLHFTGGVGSLRVTTPGPATPP